MHSKLPNPSDPLPGTWIHDLTSSLRVFTGYKWRRSVFCAGKTSCNPAMFSKPSPLQLKVSYVCLLSLFILLLVVISTRSPELGLRTVYRQPRYEFLDVKAHAAARVRPGRLDFVREEFGGRRVNVGLVNVEDEGEIREWQEVGETKLVRFDRVAKELAWKAFFPEWIDENERKVVPKCPEIPMPRFEDYEDFDVVVVRVPSGGDQPSGDRDVFRLQANLVAASLVVRSGRRVNGSVVAVFVGSSAPMLEIFRCEDLVRRVEDLRVYRPDLRRLEQKLALPLGSCQLSLPLIKHGQGRIDYDFSKMKNPLHLPKEAYVTLLHSSEAYVCGAIALARSIIQTNSTKDLVLLADNSITQKSREALKLAGWKIRDIERIRSPFARKNAYNEWNYSKLRIWQLTDYDKIIFVDSDFLILENLDGFFASPQLSAAGNDQFIFNSGIMLVEPSHCVFETLMENKERLVSYNGGDQGYLNEVFVWWHRWPNRLNWLKNFKNLNASRELPPQVYAVHYLGLKPWMCYRDYDCNWDERGHQIFASEAAHRRWWQVYDAMPRELQRFCGLPKKLGLRIKKWRANAQKANLAYSRWNVRFRDPRQHEDSLSSS
ncbi:putative UDP-glucuronate:xylan alpha-glucuronosyltransferase 5 [Aristolochia californica]|uniref:putative UDP-glucuronate:xylan alpha-glucuronosyltransferase 5 n=1 Tax=Aristolochia californica TaxID=171875 RepID=UPI0035E1F0D1